MAARELTVTRRVIAWLRLVAPPYWAVILYLVVLAGFEIFTHRLIAGDSLFDLDDPSYFEWRRIAFQPRDAMLAVGLVAWSFWRVGSTHPHFSPRYAEWLAGTPWRRGLPLPAGPIHLVPQDGVVLGLTLLLGRESTDANTGILFAAFAVSYLTLLMIACAVTLAVGYAYAIAFGLAFATWLRLPSLASIAVLIALYPVAMLGLRQSLTSFPWSGRKISSLQEFFNKPIQSRSGWPFVELAPQRQFPHVPGRDALLFPWLAAAWVFALASCSTTWEDRETLSVMGSFLLVGGATLLRVAIYVAEYRPSINLLGRIATGRLVLPAYDRVWIAPLLGVLVLVMEIRWAMWIEYAAPLAIAIGLTIQFGMGPSLKTWALTSPHRLHMVRGRSEMVEL